MEEGNTRQENGMLLTQEEQASLRLLEPLFVRHLDLILESLVLHLGSDSALAPLLSDEIEVARVKRSQQEYLFSLVNGKNEGSVGRDSVQAADYRDPFGFGPSWQLRTFVHFLTSIQPLAFEAFSWTKPHAYHTIWNALLKVIFRDLELAMSASLKQRDERVEAARQDANEAKRTLDFALNEQMAEEKQRQAEHVRVMTQLAIWRVKMSGLAREMGTPLNVILWHAESLLERTDDPTAQAALQLIVRQVERLIPLRQQLCSLNYSFRSESYVPDLEAMAEEPRSEC